MRFGRDVEWVETLDYAVDPRGAEDFYTEVRKYWPALPYASMVRAPASGPSCRDRASPRSTS